MSMQRHKRPGLKRHKCVQCKSKVVFMDMLPVKGRAGRICRDCITQNERAIGIDRNPWMGTYTFSGAYAANPITHPIGNIIAGHIKVKR